MRIKKQQQQHLDSKNTKPTTRNIKLAQKTNTIKDFKRIWDSPKINEIETKTK